MIAISTAITCLALNLYHEARGQGVEGMLAVGVVTLNRVAHPDWPDSICEVVYQPYQFSWTQHEPVVDDYDAWRSARYTATDLLVNEYSSPIDYTVLWYHADYVAPDWAKQKNLAGRIGNHLFYKSND